MHESPTCEALICLHEKIKKINLQGVNPPPPNPNLDFFVIINSVQNSKITAQALLREKYVTRVTSRIFVLHMFNKKREKLFIYIFPNFMNRNFCQAQTTPHFSWIELALFSLQSNPHSPPPTPPQTRTN